MIEIAQVSKISFTIVETYIKCNIWHRNGHLGHNIEPSFSDWRQEEIQKIE